MNEAWPTTKITCECGHKLQVATAVVIAFPVNVVHTCPKCHRRHRIEAMTFVPERRERKQRGIAQHPHR